MYEGRRLTELHEEWAWNNYHAQSDERCGEFDKAERRQAKVEALEDEIRARVAAQEIEPLPWYRSMGRLLYGIPDAIRKYPGRYDHWSYHARHAVPVEGCHLCHPQPTRWTPGGFVHEEHIPCE